jgi:hypothetical protein
MNAPKQKKAERFIEQQIGGLQWKNERDSQTGILIDSACCRAHSRGHGVSSTLFVVMRDYLQEQTAGQLIGGSFEIYGKNFGTICLLYVLPVLPVLVVGAEARAAKNGGLMVLAVLLTRRALFASRQSPWPLGCLQGNKPRQSLFTQSQPVWPLCDQYSDSRHRRRVHPTACAGNHFQLCSCSLRPWYPRRNRGPAALKRSKAPDERFYHAQLAFICHDRSGRRSDILGGVFGESFRICLTLDVPAFAVAPAPRASFPYRTAGSITTYARKEGYDITMLGRDLDR